MPMRQTRSYGWLMLAGLGLLICVFATAADHLNPILALRRDAIINGEWWRVFSGHLVHNNLRHFALNLSGLLLITLLFRDTLRSFPLVLAWILCLPLLGILIHLLDPELVYYLGLSGGLYLLLVALLIADFQQHRLLHACALLLIGVRLAWEQYSAVGSTSAAQESAALGLPTYIDAHLYGAGLGLLLGIVMQLTRHILRRGHHDKDDELSGP